MATVGVKGVVQGLVTCCRW